MTDTATALCAACRKPVQPLPEAGEDHWGCPDCGISDTQDNVLQEVKDHIVEQVSGGLDDKLRDVARKSKFITYKPGATTHRSYRFISDFKR